MATPDGKSPGSARLKLPFVTVLFINKKTFNISIFLCLCSQRIFDYVISFSVTGAANRICTMNPSKQINLLAYFTQRNDVIKWERCTLCL